MVRRYIALVVGCLVLSSSTIGAEEPRPQVSLFSCALAAAERTSVSAMLAETNLTSKSSQLETLTGLLAAAGHFDRALKLVESAEEPDRVIAPSLAVIAVGAIRSGNRDVADGVVAKLSAMKAWTVPAARVEIVEALLETGRTGDAVAMLESVGDPAARAGALIDMARSAPAASKQAGPWLQQALRAARKIRPSIGHHVEIAGWREYLEDYGEQASTLLDVAKAFSERGLIEAARKVAAVIGEVPGDGAIWKARALVAVASTPAAAGKAPELLVEALKAVEEGFEMTVGDTRDKVEILGAIARLFERLGKTKRARQALELAGTSAEKLKRVDEPGVRTSIGVETLALLAAAYADLGSKDQALTILDQAQSLVDAFVIPKSEPSSGSSWDPESSAWHTRIKARVTIAAVREQAGQSGAGTDAELIAEIGKISSRNWRDSSWLAVAQAYLGVDRPERALAVMRAGKTQASNQLRAWGALGERLVLAGRLDDAAQLVREVPESAVKVELMVGLADRFAREERWHEAEELISEVLDLGVRPEISPAGRDRLLVTVAGLALDRQSPFLLRPATAEQRQLLILHFRCRSDAA